MTMALLLAERFFSKRRQGYKHWASLEPVRRSPANDT